MNSPIVYDEKFPWTFWQDRISASSCFVENVIMGRISASSHSLTSPSPILKRKHFLKKKLWHWLNKWAELDLRLTNKIKVKFLFFSRFVIWSKPTRQMAEKRWFTVLLEEVDQHHFALHTSFWCKFFFFFFFT